MNGKNGKPVIILISLILISTWNVQHLQSSSSIKILFDERNLPYHDDCQEYWYSIRSTEWIGYSYLAVELKEQGYEAHHFNKGEITLEKLLKYDILVLTYAKFYTPKEIDVFETFVEAGGNLLQLGDPGQWRNLERVSSRFNVHYPQETIFLVDLENHAYDYNRVPRISQFFSHPITEGVQNVYFNFTTYLESYSEGEVLARSSSSSFADRSPCNEKKDAGEKKGPFNVLLVTEKGRGKVVFTGDETFMTNDWIACLDNERLALNIFEWLSERPGGSEYDRQLRYKANTLFQEGVQLFTSGEYSQAIKKFEEAEEIYRLIPMTSEAARCREYQKRSEAEYNLELGENSSSEYWISHALTLFQELGDENGVTRCKRALAKIYLDQGRKLFYQEKYQKARQELEEGLTLYNELSDSSGENFCSSLIAEIDNILQKQEEAAANFATAQQYLDTGDYSNAITYAQTAKALYVELQMETQAECDQIIAQAEQGLKKRNQIIIGVAGVLSVFCIGTGVYTLKRREPGRLQELELNLKNLNEMLKKGSISEKEFEIAKKEIEEQKKKLLKEQ